MTQETILDEKRLSITAKRGGNSVIIKGIDELVAGDIIDYTCQKEYGRAVYLGKIADRYAFTSRDPRKKAFVLEGDVELIPSINIIRASHITSLSNCSVSDTEYLALEFILKEKGL